MLLVLEMFRSSVNANLRLKVVLNVMLKLFLFNVLCVTTTMDFTVA